MALAGENVVVKLDDANGTLRTFASGDVIGVNLSMTNDQYEVTGFGDALHHYINGQMQAPVTIQGYLTTTSLTGTHTVISAAYQQKKQVSLEVQIGQNAPPTTGDPKYTGEFFIESYTPVLQTGKAIMFVASLKPATGTAPIWSTV